MREVSLLKIVDMLGAKVVGDPSGVLVDSFAPLSSALAHNITFFANPIYFNDFKKTKAGACLISKEFFDTYGTLKSSTVWLIVDDPYVAHAKLSNLFHEEKTFDAFISPHSIIDNTAQVGANCYVGHFSSVGKGVLIGANTYLADHVVIGDGVTIGANCYIHEHASIKHAVLGNMCEIHEGVRIGSYGFGFAPNINDGHVKIIHTGGVAIGNNVRIGANSCVDRGVTHNTVIGNGTKIDNLVQVAHNVKIGCGCLIAGQAGIAGSVTIEDFVFIGGQCGFAPHLVIRKGTQISPQSGVIKSTNPKESLIGTPAMDRKQFWRIVAKLRRDSK